MYFHAKDLRKGRFSCAAQIYLITTVTYQRKSFFLDFATARILINSLRESDRRNYTSTIGFVVMPDHLHWIFALGVEKRLSEVVAYIKGLSAYKIHRREMHKKFSWQAGFHDHAFRSHENILSAIHYVIENPLRAGLVNRIGDYPHWDCVYL